MSRTYKDRPGRLIWDRYDKDFVVFATEEYCHTHWHRFIGGEIVEEEIPVGERHTYTRIHRIQGKSSKPYVRRSVNTEWRWYRRTPSWWTRITMNRPQRRKGKLWERKVLFEDVEDTDPPGVSHKPHVYYY